jgi:hypothetical protein
LDVDVVDGPAPGQGQRVGVEAEADENEVAGLKGVAARRYSTI